MGVIEGHLVYGQKNRNGIKFYNFRIFLIVWLSRTFTISNKFVWPVKVRDSGY